MDTAFLVYPFQKAKPIQKRRDLDYFFENNSSLMTTKVHI